MAANKPKKPPNLPKRTRLPYFIVIMSLLSIALGLSLAAIITHFESVACVSTPIFPNGHSTCAQQEQNVEGSVDLCHEFIAKRRQVYKDRTYATKTGYRFIEENIQDETKLSNCSVVQVKEGRNS